MIESDDPFGSYGLVEVDLGHKPLFDQFFSTCRSPLSDYTFANTFIWRHCIHLRWRIIRDCLCVFANGDGGLTMLFPPLGEGDSNAALREAMAICEDYNARANLPRWTRIEYVSQETLERVQGDFQIEPMSGDYVYRTARMIDLAGADLASKRQMKNRFARRYEARTEPFEPHHARQCLELLNTWQQQCESQAVNNSIAAFKRAKEVAATQEVFVHYRQMGLCGMVLYAGQELVGFTFGEKLGADMCSILIEKTNRDFVGSANYIFSEFCRQYWADTTFCNVGDDWEIPGLAWTKQSYRPELRVPKYVLRPLASSSVLLQRGIPVADLVAAPVSHVSAESPAGEGESCCTQPFEGVAAAASEAGAGRYLPAGPGEQSAPAEADDSLCGAANLCDLEALATLENRCFTKSLAISRRQFRYLLKSPTASVHVIRKDGMIVAEAMLLRRRCASGLTGRVYSLAVDEQYRHQGLGKILLANCLKVLRAQGVSTVVLEVDAENAPAVGLYESFGFRKARMLEDYYGPGRHGWKMRLDLLKPSPV